MLCIFTAVGPEVIVNLGFHKMRFLVDHFSGDLIESLKYRVTILIGISEEASYFMLCRTI